MPDSTLDQIIHMATFAADNAALGGQHRTNAEMVHAAVRAAITAAVDNGVLVVAEDADAKLAAGFTVQFAAEETTDATT